MLDQQTWWYIALALGGVFALLVLGGIIVLVIANKKKVDASPALPSIKKTTQEEEESVEVPFAETEFSATRAAKPAATPLSRRTLRTQGSTPAAPTVSPARSFFADDEDDDFDFSTGRD